MIQDHVRFDRRNVIATWLPAPFMPPPALTRQSSGICFCNDFVVLVKDADGTIMLPGGTIEVGETFEQTLCREVLEEANALVEEILYLGAQRFEVEMQPTAQVIYQVRYWAQVRLCPFVPQYETIERLLVTPAEVTVKLQWQTTNVLRAVMEAAQSVQSRRRTAWG